MEEKNQNSNEYTGEYGNSVEAGDTSQSSIYSYSYRNQPSEATKSGDYHGEENNTSSTETKTESAGEQESFQSTSWQSQSAQQSQNNSWQSQSTQQPQNNSWQSQSTQQSQNNSWQSQSAQQPQNNSWQSQSAQQPQNDNWQNQTSQGFQNGFNEPKPAKKPEKESGLTWKKVGVCAALAAIFGVVAALCFGAVSLFTEKVLGINTTAKDVEIAKTTDQVIYDNAEKESVGTADVSGIASRTMPSIVAITSTQEGQTYYDFFGQEYQEEDIPSSGSGFIVGKNDTELLIATNNHVIAGAKTISVQFIDEEVYEAKTKGTDSAADLAVIAVKLTDIKSATLESIKIADLGDSSEAKVGEMVVAIGNALGYGQSVTVGYISAKDREIAESSESGTAGNTINVIQTDAAINPGNSGGALLNMQGEVIGINSAKIADSMVEGMGYAIPISEATPIIDELMNKEVLTEEQKGYLGISGKTVTAEAASFDMPSGVYVAEVAKGGAADKAGILPKDIITAINDIKVTTIESLQEKANSYKKGTKVTITLQRSNNGEYEEKKVEVTLQGKDSLNSLQGENSESSQENNPQNDSSPEEGSQGEVSQGGNSQEEDVPGEEDDGSGSNEEYGFNDFFGDFFPFGW